MPYCGSRGCLCQIRYNVRVGLDRQRVIRVTTTNRLLRALTALGHEATVCGGLEWQVLIIDNHSVRVRFTDGAMTMDLDRKRYEYFPIGKRSLDYARQVAFRFVEVAKIKNDERDVHQRELDLIEQRRKATQDMCDETAARMASARLSSVSVASSQSPGRLKLQVDNVRPDQVDKFVEFLKSMAC